MPKIDSRRFSPAFLLALELVERMPRGPLAPQDTHPTMTPAKVRAAHLKLSNGQIVSQSWVRVTVH